MDAVEDSHVNFSDIVSQKYASLVLCLVQRTVRL